MIWNLLFLVESAFGLLSLEEVKTCMNKERKGRYGSIYVKPEGPLSFLKSYIYHKNGLAYNKRLFSPGFKIKYNLINTEGNTAYTINNKEDKINRFRGKEGILQYPSDYHEAFKTMYNAVGGDINIQTLRDQSLYKFLTKKLKQGERFTLLASALLLSEGIYLPLKLQRKKIKLPGSQSPKEIQALRCTDSEGIVILEVEMYDIFTKSLAQSPQGSNEEVKSVFYEYSDIRKLLTFIINKGGSRGVERLKTLNLKLNDTPSFLIQSYIFEFIQNTVEADLLFSSLERILIHLGHAEGSEEWNKFFTKDEGEVKKYEHAYEALQTIDSLIAKIGFPFSVYCQPPSNMTVKGYNRKLDIEVEDTNLSFSDCCDITIYTLFCCLFYDPKSKNYKLDHLEGKKYKPTDDIIHFFKNVCHKPVGVTSQHLHQQWARVVQNLTLTEGELSGGEPYGENTIIYCKEKEGVCVELETDILNVLKVIAKVIGLSKNKMVELNEINSMAKNTKVKWYEVRDKLEEFIINMLSDISIIPLKIAFPDLQIMDKSLGGGFYGILSISFIPPSTEASESVVHVVQFSFNSIHAMADVVSKNYEIRPKDVEDLNKLAVHCEDIKTPLGDMVVKSTNRFINQSKFQPIPQETIERIAKAENDASRYFEINEILMTRQIRSINEKLYILDIFAPYLKSVATENVDSKGQISSLPSAEEKNKEEVVVNSPKAPDSPNKSVPSGKSVGPLRLQECDPLIQFISNIIGSVPLDDLMTQSLFVQVLPTDKEERQILFPNIQGSITILPELAKPRQSIKGIYDYVFFKDLHKYRMPNTLSNLYRRLRAEYGESFLNKILDQPSIKGGYLLMVEECIKTRNTEGIEAIKNDFGIQDGLIKSGPDALFGVVAWLGIAVNMDYCEGFEIAYNTWQKLLRKNDFCFVLYRLENINLLSWYPIPGGIRDRLCSNEDHTLVLLQICTCAAIIDPEFNEIFSIFVYKYSTTLCHSLVSYYDQFLKNELAKVKNRVAFTPNNDIALIHFVLRHLSGLKNLITKIIEFLEAHNYSSPDISRSLCDLEKLLENEKIYFKLKISGKNLDILHINIKKFTKQ